MYVHYVCLSVRTDSGTERGYCQPASPPHPTPPLPHHPHRTEDPPCPPNGTGTITHRQSLGPNCPSDAGFEKNERVNNLGRLAIAANQSMDTTTELPSCPVSYEGRSWTYAPIEKIPPHPSPAPMLPGEPILRTQSEWSIEALAGRHLGCLPGGSVGDMARPCCQYLQGRQRG